MSEPAKDEAELIERMADTLRACVAEDKFGYSGLQTGSLICVKNQLTV